MINSLSVTPDGWPDAVADVMGPQLVVGGPGTGKTEFLVRRALHLLDDRDVAAADIMILGFSRRGVAEVRSRLRSVSDSQTLGALDIATFHSYATRLLERHAKALGWSTNPQVLTGPEQVALVQELLATESPAQWSPAFGQLLDTRTFGREVTEFLLRASEQLMDPASISERQRADWKGLPRFLGRYQVALRNRNRIDYGTLIAAAVQLLRDDIVDPAVRQRFVLVDEYQDTTTAQVRLLQELQRRGYHILAAADPYQSIYSFRGATVENVGSFEHDFSNGSHDPRRLVLTTSFRTPATILDCAVAVTTGSLPGATGKVTPAPGQGVVEAYLFDQQVEEAEWIAAEAQRIHLSEGIPYRRIGVFVRSKRRLLADLSRALERRHIPHELPGSRLTDQPAVRFVLDLAAAATGCDGAAATQQALRRVLLGTRIGLHIGTFRSLELHSRSRGDWATAIREQLPRWRPLADLLDDSSWADSVPASEGIWRVWTTLPGIAELVTDPEASEERSAWRSLTQVLMRWEERNPEGTLIDYRRLAETEDFEAQPLLSYRQPEGDRLVLTTLHQAKGLELDVVFIADAVDGVFPDLRTRDSLLGVRHLLPNVPTETALYRTFRLQEESRLAYTAMTRARRRVVWTATERGLDDGPGRPSRFFTKTSRHLDIEPGRPSGRVSIRTDAGAGSRPPVTPQEAEAALRRCLVDVGAPSPLRLASLTVLTAGPQWDLRPARSFSGVLARGADDGLVDDNPVLSPSQAQLYEECPRRYALERRLRIGADTSLHASFGILVHDILEAIEASALAAGSPRATIETALDELHARFDPEEFGGMPFAASWLSRAEEGLARLYDKWPSPKRQAIALEHTLEAEIGGVRWTGRADRIDRSEQGIAVVDYKTSKSAPLVQEAKESLQLGFYALAAGRDSVLTRHGPVVGAELWFPMKKTKSVTTRKFEMARLDDVEARLESAAAGIIAEDWTPRPGTNCSRCRLRELCPAWTEGGPEFS